MLGALKNVTFAANTLWPAKGKEKVTVVVKMNDLGIFPFGANNNISWWLDRSELEATYLLEDGSEITYPEAKEHGVGEFCLRLLVVPTAYSGASVNVCGHPSTKEEIAARLGEKSSCNQTPHITIQVQEVKPNGGRTGRAAHAMFTRRELATDGYGVGCLAWLDCSAEGEEEVILPGGDEVKEATLRFMRDSTSGALSTTVLSLETRMRALMAGKAAPCKNLQHVFPEFSQSENETSPARGNEVGLLVRYDGGE